MWLKEKVFEKLFNKAELPKLTLEETRTYEESLKVYRDNYSVLETAKNDTRIEIARELKKNGASIDLIAKSTGLSKDQIEKL